MQKLVSLIRPHLFSFAFIFIFLVHASGKEPSCQCSLDIRDSGSIPGSGKSRKGGHGNPLQYSYQKNSMDREAWRAVVHRVSQSWTQLKQLSSSSSICSILKTVLKTCLFPETLIVKVTNTWKYLPDEVDHPCQLGDFIYVYRRKMALTEWGGMLSAAV